MVNRKKLCYTIIGLVFAILIEVWLNQKISIEFPMILTTTLMYWAIFMLVLEAFLKAIHKEDVKNNILMIILTTSGCVSMTSLLLGGLFSQETENKPIFFTIYCFSSMVFILAIIGKVVMKNKEEKDIEKTE